MDITPEKAAPDGHGQMNRDSIPANGMPVNAHDVENCFILFLGRKPEYSSIQPKIGTGIYELVREFLDAADFRAIVLPPLLLREELPHGHIDTSPSLVLIDWAQTRLPIGKSTRQSLGGARTWAQLLELLLSDSALVSISPELVAADVERILKTRLEREPLSQVRRSILGSVDSSSAFEVRGWAVDVCEKSTPVMLEFYADNAFLGSVLCNEPRPDVADVVGGSGNFGFTFKIAAAHRVGFGAGRTLTAVDSISKETIGNALLVHADAAQHSDVLADTRRELAELRKILDRIEARLPEINHRSSIPIEAYPEYWERFYRPSSALLYDQRTLSGQFTFRPLISVVIPTWNGSTRLLKKAIDSVLAQSYEQWEVVISDDASNRDELTSLFHRYDADPRIRWIDNAARVGIALNTNRAIGEARGEYIAFLDHDDELSPDALFQVASQLQHRRFRLLYSDEDRIEEDELGFCIHHTPHFKPDFDPDLLLSLNYICHLVVMGRDLVNEVGSLRAGYEGAQDHDLLLRVAERLREDEVLHLPRILYHWRVTPGSVSSTAQWVDGIQQNIVAAVDDHLQRRQLPAKAEAHNDPLGPARQFATRVRWLLPSSPPDISIIIATRDRVELLRPCVQSVLDCIGMYPGSTEILIMDNDSADPAALNYLSQLSAMKQVRVSRFHGPFNYSSINNAGARQATGEVLIFLNNDTVILTKDWCVELVSNAMRPDVGAVGARLLYPDGTIQHAGVILGIEGVAGHECVGETTQGGGYFGRIQLQRSVAAVTGACLATRKQIFLEMDGGFDELELKVAFNDVDYCMKLRKAGYRVVYNPFAVLYHLESKSRGREITQAQQERHRQEVQFFHARWSDEEIMDPYYNLHFERFARPFERLGPPPEIHGVVDGNEL